VMSLLRLAGRQSRLESLLGKHGQKPPHTPYNRSLPQQQPATIPPRITDEMHAQLDERLLGPEDGNVSMPASAELSKERMIQRSLEKSSEKNKENERPAKRRFDAPQPGASRVSPDHYDIAEESMPGPSQHKLPDPSSAQNEEADDLGQSEDEGFQESTRQPDENRRLRSVQRPPKRPRLQAGKEEVDDDPAASQELSRRQDEQLQASVLAGADEDNKAEASQPQSTYQDVNRQAKMATKRSTENNQKRVAWTESEENALLRYIAEYGSRWSQIMTVGRPCFNDKRDQVALKDKARNMKVDYLKYATMLFFCLELQREMADQMLQGWRATSVRI
jgi:hypothetical protein